MTITGAFRQQVGTLKVVKGTGGDAAITMTSVVNTAARQAVKLDLGATFATLWALQATSDLAATPSAGQTVDFYWSPSDSATAGTGNCAGATGTDAAYTGENSNLSASLKMLQYIGSQVVTASVTAQVAHVGTFRPVSRYGCLIVVNNAGSSFVANATNSQFVLRPLEDTSEAS
jgi:hypothetical protein